MTTAMNVLKTYIYFSVFCMQFSVRVSSHTADNKLIMHDYNVSIAPTVNNQHLMIAIGSTCKNTDKLKIWGRVQREAARRRKSD